MRARPSNGFWRAALSSVVNHPLNYFQSIGVFAYRGMWFMQPSGFAARLDPVAFYALSAISLLCFLGVFFRRNDRAQQGVDPRTTVRLEQRAPFSFHSALTHAITPLQQADHATRWVLIAVLWLCVAFGRYLVCPRQPRQTTDAMTFAE